MAAEVERIEEVARRILVESEQKNVAEALIADIIQFGPHGKLMALLKIADAIDKKSPENALIHSAEFILPPVLELIYLPNVLATVLGGKGPKLFGGT